MRHINFFSGCPKWRVLGGGQKVYVEKVYVLFPSLRKRCEREPDRVHAKQPENNYFCFRLFFRLFCGCFPAAFLVLYLILTGHPFSAVVLFYFGIFSGIRHVYLSRQPQRLQPEEKLGLAKPTIKIYLPSKRWEKLPSSTQTLPIGCTPKGS